MLLTLAARSLTKLVTAADGAGLSLLDLPRFTIEKLQLRGINLPSSMLSGWSLEELDRLRDRGDKAGCPCLILIEDTPLDFTAEPVGRQLPARDRVQRLAVAANRLGCNALAIHCAAEDDEDGFDITAEEIKDVMPAVERFELNLLLAPHAGLTAKPDRLTDLMKRIGGFRIGSLPDFAHAASCGDLSEALKKLVPYAGAVHATVQGFDKAGVHESYDLVEGVTAIRSVGFLNTLAIDYVGNGDPVPVIEAARRILQQAIDADTG